MRRDHLIWFVLGVVAVYAFYRMRGVIAGGKVWAPTPAGPTSRPQS